ncbi:MAG: DinB family protein [Acidobacteriota bacterium]|nr:DinB family protein [Acidobacteriota bacterium]MDH3529006.1 DinB family protein [Acidobacteriota bacterium]
MQQPESRETNTLKSTLLAAYTTKLGDLRKEIEAYENEDNIWKVAEGIINSGGNLCLHLVGNLNHFIGAMLGDTGYVRERDLEFSEKGLSREELLHRIEEVTGIVENTISGMTTEELAEDYPEKLFDKQMDKGTILAYMSGHLSYHLGQLNYHRRLLDK